MRTLHVSPIGNDATATGERDSPFRTVDQARRHALYGDEIFVHTGMYLDAPGQTLVYWGDIEEPARALLEAPEPPRRATSEYALAARTTLEKELVKALRAERDRVQEAIRLGQRRTEAMQAHVRASAVDAAMRPLQAPELTRSRRVDFVRLLNDTPSRPPEAGPQTHGRQAWASGDEIVTDDGQKGTITGPPNEKHPHTARVALEDGEIWDLPLSQLRRLR